MKKSLVTLLILTLLANTLFLGGCGKNGEQSENTNSEKIEFKEFTNDDVTFENNERFIKNQLLITAAEKFSYSDVEKAVGNYGGKIVGCIEFTNDYQVEFENADYNKLADTIKKLSDDLPDSDITLHNAFSVDSNSENYDMDFSSSEGNWWRDAINLTALERENYDYQEVSVGVFDNLFDTDQPDLKYALDSQNVWYNNTNEAKIDDHGTIVCGFIAAEKNNGIGIDGVANNVNLFGSAYKANFPSTASSSWMEIKYTFAKMISHGVKLLNMSFGFPELSVAAQNNIPKAIEKLNQCIEVIGDYLRKYIDGNHEFVIVKAPGNMNSGTWIECEETEEHPFGIREYNPQNDGDISQYSKLPSMLYTADYDFLGGITDNKVRNRIIIVGSSTKDNKRAEHSICGDRVDIYAPGEKITVLTTGKMESGTSIAAPITSGVGALMWGVNPNLKADRIKHILTSSATQPIVDENYQVFPDSGDVVYLYKYVVNAKAAVEMAKATTGKTNIDNSGKSHLIGAVKIANGESVEFGKIKCEITIENGDASNPISGEVQGVYKTFETNSDGEFDIEIDPGFYYLSAKSADGRYATNSKTGCWVYQNDTTYINNIVLEMKEYTAVDLIDKAPSEIIEIMGGDFECKLDYDSVGFVYSGFGSDGILWAYNDNTLPGFAFHPESDAYYSELRNRKPNMEIDYDSMKNNIKSGNYNFIGIAIKGDKKLNNQISADMTYTEIASVIGDFDIHCAAQGAFSYHTSINGKDVAFFFEPSDELYAVARNNKLVVSAEAMRQLNPKLEDIVVRKNN